MIYIKQSVWIWVSSFFDFIWVKISILCLELIKLWLVEFTVQFCAVEDETYDPINLRVIYSFNYSVFQFIRLHHKCLSLNIWLWLIKFVLSDCYNLNFACRCKIIIVLSTSSFLYINSAVSTNHVLTFIKRFWYII